MTYSPATEPILVDSFCRTLMRFAADHLNSSFAIAHELHKNGISRDDPAAIPMVAVIEAGGFQEYIVKSRRDSDAYDGSILEFPRLKVYRTDGSGTLFNPIMRSRIRISHISKLIEIHRLPGLQEWLTWEVKEILEAYWLSHQGCTFNIEKDTSFSADHAPRFEMVGGRQELVYRSDFDFYATGSRSK
ncbi:hypothetical protein [Allocoleopsis sp.]|uniref:hypothetical protein n=1 Tax=Allocoleopsis sp. TaxID=3088169 RepID=UPI002FCEC58D